MRMGAPSGQQGLLDRRKKNNNRKTNPNKNEKPQKTTKTKRRSVRAWGEILHPLSWATPL